MAKLKIYGNANPVVGKKEFYSVDEFFAPSPSLQLPETDFKSTSQEEVKWSIWVKYGNEWTKMISNNKTGTTVCYTFSQVSITRKGIRMLVEKNGEKALLEIQTHKTTNPSIVKVDLLDANYNIPTKAFAYGETIIARVHCVDMEMLQAKVTLWEDSGDKNSTISSNLIIESKQGNILNGICEISFYLNPMNAWRVNANNANEGEMHEYYVTAEIFTKKYNTATTKNTNVSNPQYIPSPAEQKGPSNKDQQQIAMSDRRVHDYNEQRVKISPTIAFPVREVTNSLMMVDMDPQSWWPFGEKKGNSVCSNCGRDITELEFYAMFPNTKRLFHKGSNTLSSITVEKFVKSLNQMFQEFEINTCTRKAFFLAQIARETGDFARIDEDLTYFTENALHGFWKQSSQPLLYSHADQFLKNPEKLGNYVYRNIGENGDENSGEGYKFRGRGLIQITRKNGYRRFGEYSNTNLISNPDLLLSDLNLMVRSAGWYWKHGVVLNNGSELDINTVADLENFEKVTSLVHGGISDLSSRQDILNNLNKILKTDECKYAKAEISSDADVEYHVFHSGIIRYKLQNEKRENVSYYYHDKNGLVHDIGKYELKQVVDNYRGVYKDRLGSENIYLFDIRSLKKYTQDNIKLSLEINTDRYFMNDVTAAALIGALLDCSYTDFVFNGFSDHFGNSIGGSESHLNGMNGDIRYLRKDQSGKRLYLTLESETGDPCGWKGLDEARQNKLIAALYKYGWKSMLSCKFNGKILPHCRPYNNHHHHLHVQTFTPTLKRIQ